MKPEELKKLQNTELKILEAVVALCEEQKITYFLDCGTLLGAIRHDRFIPWDDDIDISMPCEDYYRFLEIAPKLLSKKFFILNHETADNYYQPYSKVCLHGTTVLPRIWKYWDIPHGAWIDIFPMFFSDSEREFRRKRRIYHLCGLLQKKNFYHSLMLQNERRTLKSTVAYAFYSVLGIIPVRKRKKLHNRLFDYICSKKDGKYVCLCGLDALQFEKESYLGPICYHAFEQFSFRVPSDYDTVLRVEYGDYMQIPPENKRGNHGEMILEL